MFDGADLTDANFTGANVVPFGTNIIHKIYFLNSNLFNANFTSASFSSIHHVGFNGSDLTCATMDPIIATYSFNTWVGTTCPDGTLADAGTGCVGKMTRGGGCP